MEKVKVKINLTFEVEVKGKYRKPFYGNYENPPESAEFEIEKVEWQDKDITEILDKENFDWSSLEEEIIEIIQN
jgi:hypothetical protein